MNKFKVAILLGGMLSANLAQASLVSVGSGLVYDNVANVTWSSDANLFATMQASSPGLVANIIAMVPVVMDTPNAYDTPSNSGHYNLSSSDFGSGGVMDWWGGMAFVDYLNLMNGGTGFLGHNTWELPTTYTQACSGYCTNSMLGELFYTGLGGVAGTPITTTHNASYGLFTNVQNNVYWSGTEYAASPSYAWNFNTSNGYQNAFSKGTSLYSWAVLPGNAGAAVPEPAGLALFGIGLVGLMVGRRRPSFG